jgi:hypothetical protein
MYRDTIAAALAAHVVQSSGRTRAARGLAERHNTLGFLTMLHYFALTQEDPGGRCLAGRIYAALKRLL